MAISRLQKSVFSPTGVAQLAFHWPFRVSSILTAMILLPFPLITAAQGVPSASYAEPDIGSTAIERQAIRAQLMPRQYTTLAAEIGAVISKITVQEGGTFTEGQVLISLDCSLQEAQLQKALADQRSAQSVAAANMRLDELNSVGQLELDLSQAALEKAESEVLFNSTLLSKCEIHAPFPGKVAEQKARERQFVQPGEPLLDILDDSQLELEFIVPSHWLSWIRLEQNFNVIIDETRRNYAARFTRIGARVDPVSQSVKVAATIDGEYPELVAGMSGTVQLIPPVPVTISN